MDFFSGKGVVRGRMGQQLECVLAAYVMFPKWRSGMVVAAMVLKNRALALLCETKSYIYIYIYIYIFIFIYIFIYIYIFIFINLYIYKFIFIYIYFTV